MSVVGSGRKLSRVSADDMAKLSQQLEDLFKKYCAGEPQMTEAQWQVYARQLKIRRLQEQQQQQQQQQQEEVLTLLQQQQQQRPSNDRQ